jgi:exonuclease SbcC
VDGDEGNLLTGVDGAEGNLLTGVDGAEGNLLTGVKDLKGSTLADLDRQDGGVMTAGELGVWIRRRKAELDGYDRERRDVLSSIRQMEASTAGMELTDIGLLDGQIREMESRLEKLRAQERGLDSMIRTDQKIQERIVVIQRKRERLHVAYSRLNPLADAANGSFAFSRYVLNGFFERIVEHANVHLDTMTDGEYLLVPTKEGDRRSSLGLGLRILNTITNLERETASLSGGQMFEASLALALGLSDVVQMESASTIRIDSMFIDEGFGSLDGAHLDKALEVLQHLAGGKRQIGIISHVARLDECLPRKLHVIVGEHGSTVQTEVDV